MRLFAPSANNESVDWASVLLDRLNLEQLGRHRVLGFLGSRGLLLSRPEFDPPARERLLLNARREALMSQLLADTAELARTGGYSIGALKGAALCGAIYKPGERELADLDIYVALEFEKPFLTGLAARGFTLYRESSDLSGFKTVCLAPERFGDFGIEVHTKLWWREPEGFQWSWHASKNGVSCLTPEDQLIHLCTHWAAQHTMISLHWLLDIALYLRAYEAKLDWNLLRSRAELLAVTKSVALALKLCREIFGFALPTQLFAHVRLPEVSFSFLAEPREKLLRYYWLKHSVQDRWSHAIEYDLTWLESKVKARVRPPK